VTTIAERGQDAATTAGGEECEAIRQFLGIEIPCGQPAVGQFRRICVHEHVREGRLCMDHAETPRNGLCLACHDLPGDLAHECPISMTEVSS
jgi:hypothetical protein